MNASRILLLIGVIFVFTQFFYSGINKLRNFSNKVETLEKKTGFPKIINQIGMVSVILLEIIGSLIIFYCFLNFNSKTKPILSATIYLFIAFLIVVTAIYHPPGKKMIPFMSNLSLLGTMLLLIYISSIQR